MQVFGFTINLLTLLAIVLSVGLVVDDAIVVVENVERHMREGQDAARRGAARRARAGRADHRHDHHAGRGVRADRLPGRPHRLAVPRVRVHAGRRGDHLRRRGADAVADDVVARCSTPGSEEHGLAGRINRDFDRVRSALRPHARRARCDARPAVYTVWIVLSAAARSRCSCCRRRSWRPPRTRASSSASSTRRPTPRSTRLTHVHRRRSTDDFMSMPETDLHLPDHLPDRRLRRHGAQAVGRAQAHRRSRSCRRCSAKLSAHPRHPRRSRVTAAGAARRRPFPGRVRHRLDRRAASEILELRRAAAAEGGARAACSPSRRSSTCKIDQPQVEIVIDRDKVAALGLNIAAGRRGPRRRWSAATSSTASTSTAAATRSSRRSSAPSASTPTSSKTSTSPGPNGQLVPLSTIATHRRTSTEPRSLNRFQQLNAVKISGVAIAPARRGAAASWKTRPPRSCRRATSSTTPASRASCARRATSSCPRSGWRWC